MEKNDLDTAYNTSTARFGRLEPEQKISDLRFEISKGGRSEARIDGFAFQSKDGEGAFVDAAEGFVADETLQALDAEGELADGQGPFEAQAALAEAVEMLGGRVFGTVDDAEVFATAAFEGGLDPLRR